MADPLTTGISNYVHSMTAQAVQVSQQSVRQRIAEFAKWACSSSVEPFIHYQETRPIPLAQARTRKLPFTTDCSGFATMCCYAAGAPDPNGMAYNGQGYTGTMLKHLPHIPSNEAQAGDLIVYGGSTGHHVVVIVEPGPDPLVVSHGTERGPLLIKHSQESAAQKNYAGVTFLRTV